MNYLKSPLARFYLAGFNAYHMSGHKAKMPCLIPSEALAWLSGFRDAASFMSDEIKYDVEAALAKPGAWKKKLPLLAMAFVLSFTAGKSLSHEDRWERLPASQLIVDLRGN